MSSNRERTFIVRTFQPKKKAGFTLEGDEFKENLVVGVKKDSPAFKKGVKVGYKIDRVAGVRVNATNVKAELKKRFRGTKDFEIRFRIPEGMRQEQIGDRKDDEGEEESDSEEVKDDAVAEEVPEKEEQETKVEEQTGDNEQPNEEVTEQPDAGPGENQEDTKDEKEETIVQTETKVDDDGPFIAVRKEVRSLSEAETDRLVKALKRMMQNENGPDTSEYLRIASYHGDYCAHRNEQFPTWHRAYLLEMEKGLQAADRKNGGNGRIALPYWDWTDRSQETLVPRFVREEFPGVKGLKDDRSWQLNTWNFEMPSDRRMTQMLEQARIDDMVTRFLLEDEHFKASTSEVSPDSVESPHDRIHMVAGWPMTSVPLAAFSPLFYLHHCNVDRQYEKYIEMHKDSQREFEATQDMKEEQGRENLYDAWCEPFYLGEEKFMPSHCFDTKKLGFIYDKLPPTPAQQMRETPVLAVFFNVFVPNLKKKSYMVHVFLQLKSEEDPAPLPDEPENFGDDKRYAGWTAIFGGRGTDCENCVKGDPVNYYVTLNDALFNLDVDPYEVSLDVVLYDERGVLVKLGDAAGVPKPKIRGPWFSQMDNLTAKVDKDGFQGEAYMIQKYLATYGWYTGKKDGWFGNKTEVATKAFQEAMGLKPDGIAGPVTKGFMRQPRFDAHKDVVWLDDEKADRVPAKSQRNYPDGAAISYHIGTCPGYLKRESVVRDIDAAFNAWNDSFDSYVVSFKRTDNIKEAQVRVQWSNLGPKNERRFDGRGGMLAESTKSDLSFDIFERWLTSDQEAGRREFYIGEVAAHEIGHVLGLGHSNKRTALMFPYYEVGRLKPTEDDLMALKDAVEAELSID